MSANSSRRDGADGSGWWGSNEYGAAPFAPPFGGFSLRPSTGSGGGRQIVFIDGSVPDAQLLAAGVKPGVIAVVLDPAGNELEEMAAYLASHHLSGLAAIDIVAHGADGVVALGTAQLSAATIGTYAPQLAAIGAALAPGGAIQLYGCDVAEDAAGDAFLQQLSQAPGGANIAAASHLVGAASGGGSWTLNVDVGTVNVAAPFTTSTLADYQGELSSAPTGNLWLGSWNGEVNSNLNQLDALSVSGRTVLSTTDVADTLKSGDGSLNAINSLAIDPATGKAFILGPNQIGNNGNISYVPTAGGAYTSIYSAPDTGEGSSETGFIGEIRVDEQNSTIFFTQSDFSEVTGAQYTADTGVFVIPETGGTPTQVINDITGGTTLYNPTSMELDLPDNLVFFVENDTYFGGGGTAELYVGSLTNHNYEALLTLPLSGALNPNFLITTALAIDPSDHIIYFSTYQPADPGYSGFAGIYSVSYTPDGTSTTIGATNTLYLGAAAQVPDALAVDPAHSLLYVSGTTYGNAGSSDAASAWVGSTSGSGPLSEIFQLGGQTLNDYSYTTAAAFEAAPSLSASGTVTFLQGGAAVTLDSALTISDESEPDLASATVSIVGLVSGDTLAVGSPGGLSESFSNGTLTLTGVASLATYQTALDSVAFSTTSTSGGTRTISWTVSDGIVASATGTSTVDVHTAPTLSAGGTVTFDGGGAPVTLDSGLSVSDPSSTTLESATVVIGGFISGDTLSVDTPGGLGTSFSNGILTLTGLASLVTYQTALHSIVYSFNPSDGDPTGGGSHTSRTIAWVVNDGVASSATGDSTLDVVHVAPTLTAGATATFDGGGGAVTLDAGLSLSDPDSNGTLSSATVSISSGFHTGDTLGFTSQGGISGSYDSATGVLTLTGTASLAAFQAELESVTYGFTPSTGDPTAGGGDTSRTISWVANDGVTSSATADSTLHVVHVAPSVVAGATATYEPFSAPVTLDPALSVSDPDSGGTLAGATVSVGSGFLAGDTLNFSNQNGIAGSYSSGSGVLTLSGSASLADYQAALESITYSFSGDASDGGADPGRTINWVLTDGVDSSALAASALETPCYLRGTHILTPAGEVLVETLKPGDAVLTHAGLAKPISWIGCGVSLVTPINRERVRPVIIRRGALADGVPHRDLYLTNGHSVFFDGVLIQAEWLVNGRSILWDDTARAVEYYHIELDEHDLLVAEGAPAESYIEDNNRDLFQNAPPSQHALRPKGPTCAPVISQGVVVDAIWRLLSDRAGLPVQAMTEDPDLHVLLDDERIAPTHVDRRVYRFTMPAVAGSRRLCSRSSIPAHIGRNRDQRRLGVAFSRLELHGQGRHLVIQSDAPGFTAGAHPPEAGFRWTDGDLLLPASWFAAFPDGCALEVHVTHVLPYAAPAATPCSAEAEEAGRTRSLALAPARQAPPPQPRSPSWRAQSPDASDRSASG